MKLLGEGIPECWQRTSMSSVCRKSRKNLGSSSGCLEAGTAERASSAGYFLRTLDLFACMVTGSRRTCGRFGGSLTSFSPFGSQVYHRDAHQSIEHRGE